MRNNILFPKRKSWEAWRMQLTLILVGTGRLGSSKTKKRGVLPLQFIDSRRMKLMKNFHGSWLSGNYKFKMTTRRLRSFIGVKVFHYNFSRSCIVSNARIYRSPPRQAKFQLLNGDRCL